MRIVRISLTGDGRAPAVAGVRFHRPRGLLAGFLVDEGPGPDSVLREAGELWTPRDWRVGWHGNPGWELYYQRLGRSVWETERGRFTVPPGGFYLVAPGQRHRARRFPDAESHFFFVVFDPAALGHAPAARWPRPWVAGGGAQALELPFRGLIRELTLASPDKEAGLRLYLAALGREVDRLLGGVAARESGLRSHPASLRAQELLLAHPGHAWRLDELAALAGVSVPHLVEVFRRDFGRPPRQYLLEHRIALATEWLQRTDWTITQIAHQLGFSSSQHFAHAYRQRAGLAPGAVRRDAVRGEPGQG